MTGITDRMYEIHDKHFKRDDSMIYMDLSIVKSIGTTITEYNKYIEESRMNNKNDVIACIVLTEKLEEIFTHQKKALYKALEKIKECD